MAYTGGHKISNSFQLKLKNLSGETQTINLFEVGASGDNVPVEVEKKEKNDSTFIVYFNGVSPFENKDITLKENTIFRLTFTTTPTIQFTMNIGDDLNQVNARINSEMQSVDAIKNNMFQISWDIVDYAPSKVPNYFILTATDNGSTNDVLTKITLINTGQGSNDVNITTFPITTTSMTPNFVEVQGGGGSQPRYAEIQESQNGQVYDIAGVDLDVLNSRDAQQQMLGCLRFTKKDSNGDDLEHFKCPVLDGYQYQNSYGFVDMETEVDKFTLDGQTKFSYDILANSSLNIGYNYSVLPNLLSDSAYGMEQVEEQNKTIDNYKNVGDKNRVIDVDIDLKDLKNVETPTNIKKKTKKTINPLLVFGGIVLLGIILNKK